MTQTSPSLDNHPTCFNQPFAKGESYPFLEVLDVVLDMSMSVLVYDKKWTCMGLQGLPATVLQNRRDINMSVLQAKYGWLFPASDRLANWKDPANLIYMFYHVPSLMSGTHHHFRLEHGCQALSLVPRFQSLSYALLFCPANIKRPIAYNSTVLRCHVVVRLLHSFPKRAHGLAQGCD